MGHIFFSLPEEEEKTLRAKAKSLGLPLSSYLRLLIRDAQRRNANSDHTSVLRAIQALVPTMAEALGRTQNAGPEQVEKLVGHLKERFKSEI